jgi:hypothetical protein
VNVRAPTVGRIFSVSLLLAAIGLWLLLRQAPPPTPNELGRIDEGTVSPRGDWIQIRGTLRFGGERYGFLFHPASRKFVSIGKEPAGGSLTQSFAFSSDGTRAAWVQERPKFPARLTFEVFATRLDPGSSKPVRLPFSFSTAPRVALSPLGSRIALLEGDALSVIDVESGRTLSFARLLDLRGEPTCMAFLNESVVRLYPLQRPPRGPRTHTIRAFDVATGQLSIRAAVESDAPGMFLRPSATGDRVLALEHERSEVTLLDGTGAPMARLRTGGKLRAAEFLSDGRIAAVLRDGDHALIRVFSSAGEEIANVSLEVPTGGVALLGEPAQENLLVALNPRGPTSREEWSLFLIDLARATVISRTKGLAPLDPMAFWRDATVPTPDRVGGRLRILLDSRGALVEFNALTGERRILLDTSP